MQSDPIKTFRQTDLLDPARATAMQATLGENRVFVAGDALPPFYHYLYFWDAQPPSRLGRDGHPRVGGIIPDMELPRRMWAGGQLEFHTPLRVGHPTIKEASVAEATHKQGRSGPLGFVKMRHDFWQEGQLCVTEFQDLVYRQDPSPNANRPLPPMARIDETTSETYSFDTTMLFRYSALTFNGHRIHYDIDYAQNVEGYDGLVTHGPLLAQLLMLMAQRKLGTLKRFEFRATSPLMHFEKAVLCWTDTGDCWVRAPDGRQNMIAKAS